MHRRGLESGSEHFDGSLTPGARAVEMVRAIRQNHALEHATIAILMSRLDGKARVIGRAGLNSFSLYGDLPTDAVDRSAREALRRLQGGERDLAVSPMCGTNVVVAGLAAGVASIIAGRGHKGMSKVSRVVQASVLAILIAQPLGYMAQKHITTSSQLDNVSIASIVRRGSGKLTRHKIELVRS